MPFRAKKIKFIFIIYWFLLAYIIAALVWWYIALSRQNDQMAMLKTMELQKNDPSYPGKLESIQSGKHRKTAQYIGEGSIFLLLISAGAIFVYRSVNRQLKVSVQQQNFMMAITHELKTPIAISKLNLETLQLRKLNEAQQHKLIQNTLQEVDRMNALCNNMLLSSQIEAGGYRMTREETDLGALVQDCVTDFRTRFPERTIETRIAPDANILADSLLIQMAINNLLDNALKYSGKEDKVHVSLEKKENIVELRVADEGPGIDEKEKTKVFEKFYRLGNEATKRSKGTGLGLYLAKRIIAAHQGNIFISNQQPAGAVFVLQFQHAV